MTPFWPITGTTLRYPSWVVFAVFMSFLTSIFIAIVILFVWKDSEDNKNEPSQNV
jgi:preprotein translocase subunit SecF